jgi:hypothetical protein
LRYELAVAVCQLPVRSPDAPGTMVPVDHISRTLEWQKNELQKMERGYRPGVLV